MEVKHTGAAKDLTGSRVSRRCISGSTVMPVSPYRGPSTHRLCICARCERATVVSVLGLAQVSRPSISLRLRSASVVRRSRVTSVFPPRIFPRRLTIRLNHADRWMLESLAAGRGKMLLGRGTRNRGLCNFRCCQLVVRCSGRSVVFGFVPGIPSSFAFSCMLYRAVTPRRCCPLFRVFELVFLEHLLTRWNVSRRRLNLL